MSICNETPMTTTRANLSRSTACLLTVVVLLALPIMVEAACPRPGAPPPEPHSCPLVLDLNDDGIYTTSIYDPVQFDFDGDGITSPVTWINPQTGDAFLVLDLNGNGTIDSGQELFGNATLLPDGSQAANGFEALSMYDTKALGGNSDGRISPEDRAWRQLRLWRDLSYDGHTDFWELMSLRQAGVDEISLEYVEVNERDGNLNYRWLRGAFIKRIDPPEQRDDIPPIYRAQDVEDIFFYSSEQ